MVGDGLAIVQPEALWERVATSMRRAIVLGELVPGDRLKEPYLAERFGVSRLPIREAITQLEREGLVYSEPRRGAFVIGVTEQDIIDVYECRLMIEERTIERVAERITVEEVANLYATIDQMEAGVAADQMPQIAVADMEFHRQLIRLSGNRALRNAWEPVAPLIETTMGIADAGVADIYEAVYGHRPIVQALDRHDAAAARSLLHTHLLGGEGLMLDIIRTSRAREHHEIMAAPDGAR